jgi:ABC-type bacteriocin/lantibiotic exporter with double-glycine peptidase domain
MGAFNYQDNSYSCGTLSVMNVAKVLGVDVSYDEAKSLAGTTSRNGTSRSGIRRALNTLGFSAIPYSTNNSSNALRWLWKWSYTCPIILLVDSNEHWVSVTGRVSDKIILIDPSPNLHKGENGVHTLGREELLQRWLYRRCYAIRVHRA